MSSQNSSHNFNLNSQPPNLDSNVMVAAIIVLFVVVFFVLCLHIYAKWCWGASSAFRSISRRGQPAAHHLNQQPVGLSKEVIHSLPTFTYQEQAAQRDEVGAMECAVCLSEFQEDEEGRMLPRCKHVFHIQCIDMWFSSHNTCPLCRTAVVEEASSSPTSNTPLNSISTASDGEPRQRAASMSNLPSNVLFWGNHNQVSYQSGPSTRPPPQTSIQISSQRFHESTNTIPEAPTPLDSSASNQECSCKTVDSQGASSSQSFRSPSLRNSIKRLLSRGRRTVPSEEEREQTSASTTITITINS